MTITRLLSVALTLCLCALAQHVKIIQSDFSTPDLPGELNLNRQWKVDRGVLACDGKGTRSLQVKTQERSSMEVEVRMRTVDYLQKDHHVGLIFKTGKESVQLYTRGAGFILWIPSLNWHSQFGVPFEKPMEAGRDAPWNTLRVMLRGQKLTVFMDGRQVAATNRFPGTVRKLSLYAYHTRTELDDLKVMLLPMTERKTAVPESPNLALNASFETCTLDGLPDYWGVPHWGMVEPKWIIRHEEWRRYFRTDDTEAWHGKRSMRLENAEDAPPDISLVMTSCNFGTQTGTTYTYSAYMKADRPGVRVRLMTSSQNKPYDGDGMEVQLTQDWKRYCYTYTRKENTLYHDQLRAVVLNRGVAWIDAVQLEQGKKATPFQLARSDRALNVHEGNVEKELFQVPVHHTPLLSQSPVLDGKLDDGVWKNLKPLPFKTLYGKPPREKTTVKIFYTDEGIYLGLHAEEAGIARKKCLKQTRDAYVWNDSSCEIFVDSKLSRGAYHHLSFNVDGVQYDARNNNQVAWNGNWQVKTARMADGSGWTAEVFLPFSDYCIDQNNGDRWGFNVCRSNPDLADYTCWATTHGGFHSPLRFGQLTIDREIQKQYFVGVRKAQIRYAGKRRGELVAEVFNDTEKEQKMTVRCALPDDSLRKSVAFTRELTLPPTSSETVVFGELSCLPGEEVTVRASIHAGTRRLHYSELNANSAKLLTALVQYDYYTGEKELNIRGQVMLNAAMAAEATLLIRIEKDGKTVYEKPVNAASPKLRHTVPIADWPLGNYRMTATLRRGNGDELAQAVSDFQKLPPAAREVKLDRFRRITVVNGKPFLPLGFFWEGHLTPELVDFLAKQGVNYLHSYAPDDFMNQPQLFEVANGHGLMYGIDVKAREGRSLQVISKLKHEPSILNWYTYDEAFTTDWGKSHYPEIIRTIDQGQKADPHRPVILLENHYGMAHLAAQRLPFPGKIPTLDYYCYPPSASVAAVHYAARKIMDNGKADGRPAWLVLFATGYAFHASRDMTPAEHEYQAYISLIDGVRGLAYWASFPKSISSFRKLMDLFGEIKSLQAPLVSLEETPNLSCTSPHIRFTVKRHEGALYLITVNERRQPLTAQFTLPQGTRAQRADVLFEDRQASLKNACLEDTWQGLQRHVYRIR